MSNEVYSDNTCYTVVDIEVEGAFANDHEYVTETGTEPTLAGTFPVTTKE